MTKKITLNDTPEQAARRAAETEKALQIVNDTWRPKTLVAQKRTKYDGGFHYASFGLDELVPFTDPTDGRLAKLGEDCFGKKGGNVWDHLENFREMTEADSEMVGMINGQIGQLYEMLGKLEEQKAAVVARSFENGKEVTKFAASMEYFEIEPKA